MPKWLIWLLLEFSTFLLILSAVFVWLTWSLNKKLIAKKNSHENQENIINAANSSDDSLAYKKLVQFIDSQIQYAANLITKSTLEKQDINKFKIWGTLLRAERAILLNQVSEKPQPILSRFLSSMLYALSAPKLQTTDPDELNRSISDMQSEFYQTAELLISKESLLNNQKSLNDDISRSIDRAQKRVDQLKVKQIEEKRLEIEINDLKKKTSALKAHQVGRSDNVVNFEYQWNVEDKEEKPANSSSYLQIAALNGLSNRQKVVIEQLKAEIKKASKNDNVNNSIANQKMAIQKLERVSFESKTLITQLEEELKLSSISIDSLKQDISYKDLKLAELEQQLTQSNETAIGNLQSLTANKKETFGSLREELDSEMKKSPSKNLTEQDKDAKTLERLLLESETCVTLLAQELELAEETNEQLKTTLSKRLVTENSKNLDKQRALNKELSNATTMLKQKLMSETSNLEYQALRAEYNKKSLECDRIQLAYSDLEKKYLRAIDA